MADRRTWSIVDALRDPAVFGALPAFADLRTWSRWLVFLKCLYGLPLDPRGDADLPAPHGPRHL